MNYQLPIRFQELAQVKIHYKTDNNIPDDNSVQTSSHHLVSMLSTLVLTQLQWSQSASFVFVKL
jgi:hypothetical protein